MLYVHIATGGPSLLISHRETKYHRNKSLSCSGWPRGHSIARKAPLAIGSTGAWCSMHMVWVAVESTCQVLSHS